MVETTSIAPQITGFYTPEMLAGAKEDALRRISELNLPVEMTKDTIDWINNDTTVFTPPDVDEIIKNLKTNSI